MQAVTWSERNMGQPRTVEIPEIAIATKNGLEFARAVVVALNRPYIDVQHPNNGPNTIVIEGDAWTIGMIAATMVTPTTLRVTDTLNGDIPSYTYVGPEALTEANADLAAFQKQFPYGRSVFEPFVRS